MGILERLVEERIVSFTLSQDKLFLEVSEECDNYFTAKLTKRDLDELISSLNCLYDQMQSD